MNTRTVYAAAACMGVALNSLAAAQVASYEVIDLGALSAGSSTPYSDAFSINNLHEVVGSSRASSGDLHATVWLYCPNFGLTAGTWHDLTAMASLSWQGLAHGINDAGLVVGGQVSTSGGPERAFLWDLSVLPTVSTLSLDTLVPSNTSSVGTAYAVNNASPAVIVGNAQIKGACLGTQAKFHAFRYLQGDAPSAIDDLGAANGDSYSIAGDVNTTSTPSATGRSTQEFCLHSGCEAEYDSVKWTLSTSPSLTVMPSTGTSYGAEAWGVNDSGHAVGGLWTASSPCYRHAAFWATSSSSPVDLGAIVSPSTDVTRTYEISNQGSSGELTAVGVNDTNGLAYRWYRNGSGTWSAVNLNTKISPLCGWTLQIAYDVSDDGWIVGVGSNGSEIHGFLLRPMTCVGDLVQSDSCTVDGADLGALLGAWGSCPPLPATCSACIADIDLNGIVDGADLGALLGNWGATCECCPTSGFNGMAGSSGDSEEGSETSLDQGLSLLGFGSVQAFNDWSATASAVERAGALDWLMSYLMSGL